MASRRIGLARPAQKAYIASPAPSHDRLVTVSAASADAPVFTHGSTMRHVAVMTATGSIGLMAIFSVDVLSLFWVSRLGVEALKAAIGYASQLQFLGMSVNIGARRSPFRRRCRARWAPATAPRARRLAASGLTDRRLVAGARRGAAYVYRESALDRCCTPRASRRESPATFSRSSSPPMSPMALGMALSGVLRAARRRAARDVS